MEYETRSGLPVEVREDSGSVIVEGYAAVFDQPTNIGDVFTEVIARGAFKNALSRGDDTEFLINHGGLPLARSTAGNLTMTEDDHGLKIRAVLDPTDPDVQRIIPKMRAKMLDQMSFAFQAAGQRWDTPADGPDVRTITDVVLYDVSIVNRGAYPTTSIALRARDDARAKDEARKVQADRNAKMAEARIAERKAASEQRFRGIAVARMMDDGLSPLEEAMKWLDKAIKRHERHMDGTESTSEASQQKMMDEMMAAMDALKRFTES